MNIEQFNNAESTLTVKFGVEKDDISSYTGKGIATLWAVPKHVGDRTPKLVGRFHYIQCDPYPEDKGRTQYTLTKGHIEADRFNYLFVDGCIRYEDFTISLKDGSGTFTFSSDLVIDELQILVELVSWLPIRKLIAHDSVTTLKHD